MIVAEAVALKNSALVNMIQPATYLYIIMYFPRLWPRGAKQASRTRVYEPGEASELRGSAAWATVTALVDSAHEAARGAAHGGSGGRAEDLLPSGEGEGRAVYVLAYARAGLRRPGAGPDPDPDTTGQARPRTWP